MPDKTESDKADREKVSGLIAVLEFDTERLAAPVVAKGRVAQLKKMLAGLPDDTDSQRPVGMCWAG